MDPFGRSNPYYIKYMNGYGLQEIDRSHHMHQVISSSFNNLIDNGKVKKRKINCILPNFNGFKDGQI